MKPRDPNLARLDSAIEALIRHPTADPRTRALAHLLRSIVELMSPAADADATPSRYLRPPARALRRRRRQNRWNVSEASGPHFPRLTAAIESGVNPIEVSTRSDRAPTRGQPPRPRESLQSAPWLLSRARVPPIGMSGRSATMIGLGMVLAVSLVGAAFHTDGRPSSTPAIVQAPATHESVGAAPPARVAAVDGPQIPAIASKPVVHQPVRGTRVAMAASVDDPSAPATAKASVTDEPVGAAPLAIAAAVDAPRMPAIAPEPAVRESVGGSRVAMAASVDDHPAPATTENPLTHEPVGGAPVAIVSPPTSVAAGEVGRHTATIGAVIMPRVQLASARSARTSPSKATLSAAMRSVHGTLAATDQAASPPRAPVLSRPPAEPVAVVLAARLAEGEALYQRGWELQQAGDGEQAIALYRTSSALDPGHAATYYNWGYVLQQRGDRAAAIDLYRRAIARDPNHVYAHYNMAWLLEGNGDDVAAEELYRRAIAIDPNHIHSLYNLANLLDRHGDADAALDLYRRVLALDPKHHWATVDLRDLLARLDAKRSPQSGSGRS